MDYAATGAGLWAAHLIFSRYLAYANPGVAPIRLNLVVIPSTLPQSYRTIIEVLHDLDPIILLTPQAEEESITTQILDSKFLSKQGLKLCKAINLEHIIQGAIKKIPIDHNGFIALQLLMRAIMQGVSIELASRSRDRVLQTCESTSRALQTIDFTPTEQRGICGLGDAPNGFFAKAKELKGTMDAASSNSNNVKTEYGCS
ncbi:hypothetical protein [Legionella sp. km772]|uniref:hypothetical protein n=1 Tax=Legionella sp. km772 TaxID=2498111 RepID=UPI000F8E7CC7|nr:hypothetical protein [Legionella sp. km772]RUR04412.1 hypothetical protein ELY15_15545 [Legionella sp. km772]